MKNWYKELWSINELIKINNKKRSVKGFFYRTFVLSDRHDWRKDLRKIHRQNGQHG